MKLRWQWAAALLFAFASTTVVAIDDDEIFSPQPWSTPQCDRKAELVGRPCLLDAIKVRHEHSGICAGLFEDDTQSEVEFHGGKFSLPMELSLTARVRYCRSLADALYDSMRAECGVEASRTRLECLQGAEKEPAGS